MLRRVVRGILIRQRLNTTRVELWGLHVPDWKEQDCGFTVSNNNEGVQFFGVQKRGLLAGER